MQRAMNATLALPEHVPAGLRLRRWTGDRRLDRRRSPQRSLKNLLHCRARREGWELLALGDAAGRPLAASCAEERTGELLRHGARICAEAERRDPGAWDSTHDTLLELGWTTAAGMSVRVTRVEAAGEALVLVGMASEEVVEEEYGFSLALPELEPTAWRAVVIRLEERIKSLELQPQPSVAR